MLRYRYEHSFSSRIRACRECKLYRSCEQHSYKFNDEFGECMDGEFEYKHPEATKSNVDWLVFQILRSLMLSKLNAGNLIRDYRMDWVKPESLKDHYLPDGPSVAECCAFITALTAFSNFVSERRNKFAKMRGDTTSTRMAFVNSIKDTYIEVNDNEVKLYTFNSELLLRVKDEVKAEKYSFRVINNTQVKECLAQPMNEN